MAYNEDEAVESLKTWWQRYGMSLLLGVAVAGAGVAGWRWWQADQINSAAVAQTIQQQMNTAAQRSLANPDDKAANTDLQRLARQLMDEHASTPYAVDAALMLARHAVETAQLPQAEKHLRWVLDQKPDEETRLLVHTRLARVLIAKGDLAAAEEQLKAVDSPALLPLVAEIRGDLALHKNDRAAAAKAYAEADQALAERNERRPVLELKLADVGLAPADRASVSSPVTSEVMP